MQVVSGRLSKFLRDQASQLIGFVLDRGQEVRFWLTDANVRAITKILTIGSRVEVQGDFHCERVGEEYFQAALVSNLDSKQTVSVLAPVRLDKPGMPFDATPSKLASLAHPQALGSEGKNGLEPSGRKSLDALEAQLEKLATKSRPLSASYDHRAKHNLLRPPATRNDAGTAIERAYDILQRLQAVLAYLQIMKRHVPGISQFLNESKHTYEQSLWRYEADDFEGAREFAAASAGLALVVEIIISRTLRSDTSYPSLVPPPPQHLAIFADSIQVQESLEQVENLLARIHWLMDNGTLPLEDRAQVRRIASWSESLYGQARRLYGTGSQEDATELLEAAYAAAGSAEHVCRKWYVSQSGPPCLLAPERAH
jgi:hypothetical protein